MMTLLELAQDLGLDTKKTSHCKGGEYHAACPSCGEGKDRFVIWPALNRYWCRRCDAKGDAIQFCRDFMKMTFHEACNRINDTSRFNSHRQPQRPTQERLVPAQDPPKVWQDKALAFVEWAHKQLERFPMAIKDLYQRGFNDQTITKYKLGYSINPFSSGSPDFFRDRVEWGLPREYKENGRAKKLWLPYGLVIPTMANDGRIVKLKIRRQSWHKDDSLPKYVEIAGSMQSLSVYGMADIKIAIILESELDAMLIQQEAQDLCFCVALGGATKKPDAQTNQALRQCSLILWSLDNDEAGKKEALWWREAYPQLRFWSAPIGKSPGDAFQHHALNICEWVKKGIAHYNKKTPENKEISL